MPIPTIDEVRALANLTAEGFRYNFLVTRFPSIGSWPDLTNIDIRCRTTELPKVTNEKYQVPMRGNVVNAPGRSVPSGTITVTFFDTVDNIIIDMVEQWRNLIFSQENATGYASEQVKGDITIRLLDRQNGSRVDFKLLGCFIEDFDYGSPDSEANEPLNPSITFSYDNYKVTSAPITIAGAAGALGL